MNYYYIDYMVKERQKLLLEESKKQRRLRMANLQSDEIPKMRKFWRITLPDFLLFAAVKK